ncbi:MAG: hypothetical protein OXC08_17925 [Thiotrichales bacterium]|nr:hypothetical protein [Thiotrichales bacterium]
MKPPTFRPRSQLQLSLEPPAPAAARSTALLRALADLLLEALVAESATTDAMERIDELEDHL